VCSSDLNGPSPCFEHASLVRIWRRAGARSGGVGRFRTSVSCARPDGPNGTRQVVTRVVSETWAVPILFPGRRTAGIGPQGWAVRNRCGREGEFSGGGETHCKNAGTAGRRRVNAAFKRPCIRFPNWLQTATNLFGAPGGSSPQAGSPTRFSHGVHRSASLCGLFGFVFGSSTGRQRIFGRGRWIHYPRGGSRTRPPWCPPARRRWVTQLTANQ